MDPIDIAKIEAVIALADEYRLWVEKQIKALSAGEIHPWCGEWRGPSTPRSELEHFIREQVREEQEAMVALFWMGSGVEQDWEEAVQEAKAWIQDAAAYLSGMVHLGDFLREGLVLVEAK